jgi:formylglycine-generating enzyme required for sulfatase activity
VAVEPDLVDLPGGTFGVGSARAEVAAATAYWGPRLLDASFTVAGLWSWLAKEAPAHPVTLAPFAMSRFPVTNAAFSAFVTATGAPVPESLTAGEPADHPVWGVSHDDARRYCGWLGTVVGRPFRLPTEAEWEYAARGPSHREYPFGDRFDAARCNTAEAGIAHTTPVDRYLSAASGWGVVDLAGNVEEWTGDTYGPYPGGTRVDDDVSAAAGGAYPVLRGGSFARGGDLARCARRHGPHPGLEYRYRGFRVVSGGTAGAGFPRPG